MECFMKKKCPLCNKFIEVEDKPKSFITEMKCPKCDGELVVFTESSEDDDYYRIRVEGKNYIRVKCPACKKFFIHEIQRDFSDNVQSFDHFHQNCPLCNTSILIHGLIINDTNGTIRSIADAYIDTFAEFPSAHYIIAAKAPFNKVSNIQNSSSREAKNLLKSLLRLPDDRILSKRKRYDDYKLVSKNICSYIVSNPKDIEQFIPKDFSIIFASDNLLFTKEKKGDFFRLLKVLISMTNSVKDVCGKASITNSVINDLNNIPSEIPHKWVKDLETCQCFPGYNLFDPFYNAPIFIDFRKLNGFNAERHLYKVHNKTDIIQTFTKDPWYLDFGCIHPVNIINYAIKNIVNPDSVIDILTNAKIPIFELDKKNIDWHNYEHQFNTLKLKEDALDFAAGRSIRQALGNKSSVWINTRKIILEKQNYTCQICGYHTEEGKYLHAHEVWEKGPAQNVLCLVDIQLLCNRCHDCKHIGQFLMRKPTNLEHYDKMIMHMAKVNNCSPALIYAYHKYRIEQISKRQITKFKSQKNNFSVSTKQTVQYIINDNVVNKTELLVALEDNGLLYHAD